ncbi:MAG: YceI family protein [Terriglobia bacterium]
MKATRLRLGLLAGLLLAPSTATAEWALKLERNHSTVSFSVPIVAGMTTGRGTFKNYDVEFVYDEEDISQWSVRATIKTESVDTDIEMRDRDLRGPLFFDAANHPEITFQSKRIEKRGEGYVAIGTLTMRGVTKGIELPFVITAVQWGGREEKRPQLGVAVKWTVNRQDYGLGSDWRHSAIPNFIGDDVTVEIFLWTRRGRRPAASDE